MQDRLSKHMHNANVETHILIKLRLQLNCIQSLDVPGTFPLLHCLISTKLGIQGVIVLCHNIIQLQITFA